MTLLKALDHPNVLRFIGILFQPGKLLTLITEYAGGGTLRQKIKRLSETFEWSLRVQIARDIAAGMVRQLLCNIHSGRNHFGYLNVRA